MADEWTEHAREEEMRQLTERVVVLETNLEVLARKVNELVDATNLLIESVLTLNQRRQL